jgi:hypothetical protein
MGCQTGCFHPFFTRIDWTWGNEKMKASREWGGGKENDMQSAASLAASLAAKSRRQASQGLPAIALAFGTGL